MTNIGIAVLGAGRMGKRRARAVVQNLNSNLICIVDSDFNVSKDAKELGCDFYSNYRDVLNRSDIDAVILALPNYLHKTIAIEALTKKIHVFCEKPLAITVEDAKLMVSVSIANQVFLKTGSNARYFHSILKAKDLLDNGHIGEVLFSRGWIGHEGWNLKKNSWFSDPQKVGGGTLIDNGCHLVDLVRWFVGEIVECQGYTTTQFHTFEGLEDNAMAILVGESGIPSFIQSSWTEWNGYLYIEIYGQKGIIRVDNRGENDRVTLQDYSLDQHKVFDYCDYPKTSFKDEVDNFIESIRTHKQPQPSGYDGMRVIQIIDGIYKSAKQGLKINVFSEEDNELKKRMAVVPNV